MRPREDIKAQQSHDFYMRTSETAPLPDHDYYGMRLNELQLEVLLDLRDLLVAPPSAPVSSDDVERRVHAATFDARLVERERCAGIVDACVAHSPHPEWRLGVEHIAALIRDGLPPAPVAGVNARLLAAAKAALAGGWVNRASAAELCAAIAACEEK